MSEGGRESERGKEAGREGGRTLTEYQTANHQVEICFWYAVLLKGERKGGKEGGGEGETKEVRRKGGGGGHRMKSGMEERGIKEENKNKKGATIGVSVGHREQSGGSTLHTLLSMIILYMYTYSLFLVPLEEILTEGRLVGPGIAAAIIGTGLRGAGGFLESKCGEKAVLRLIAIQSCMYKTPPRHSSGN